MLRDLIYDFYHKVQQNKRFLGLIAWLQEHYVTVVIGDIVNEPSNVKYRRNPEKYLSKSREFFAKNKDRVKNICNILADEKSRVQYMAAIKYRVDRRPIKHSEYSLTDQYFPRDLLKKGLISVASDTVFVDGGAYNGDTIRKVLKIACRQNGGGG